MICKKNKQTLDEYLYRKYTWCLVLLLHITPLHDLSVFSVDSHFKPLFPYTRLYHNKEHIIYHFNPKHIIYHFNPIFILGQIKKKSQISYNASKKSNLNNLIIL